LEGAGPMTAWLIDWGLPILLVSCVAAALWVVVREAIR
jgi:hypothetical protein